MRDGTAVEEYKKLHNNVTKMVEPFSKSIEYISARSSKNPDITVSFIDSISFHVDKDGIRAYSGDTGTIRFKSLKDASEWLSYHVPYGNLKHQVERISSRFDVSWSELGYVVTYLNNTILFRHGEGWEDVAYTVARKILPIENHYDLVDVEQKESGDIESIKVNDANGNRVTFSRFDDAYDYLSRERSVASYQTTGLGSSGFQINIDTKNPQHLGMIVEFIESIGIQERDKKINATIEVTERRES